MAGKIWDFITEYWIVGLVILAMVGIVWSLVSAHMWGQDPENKAWMDASITAMTRGEFYAALGVAVVVILIWGGGKKE